MRKSLTFNQKNMNRSKRTLIAKDTLAIIKQGHYQAPSGRIVSIQSEQQKAEQETKLYAPEELQSLIQQQPTDQGSFSTQFIVNDLTTLDSVRAEHPQDSNLLCLNFASARNPGGGFLNGSQAQEESIARATGLYPCLLKAEPYYVINRAHESCIYTDHMIYSPAVPVLKNEKGDLLEDPVFTTIVTAPAVNAGAVLRNEPERSKEIEPRLLQRMDMLLALCVARQHKTLILGAWGCGVFRNDPTTVAQLFATLLRGKYEGQFERVIFSVYAREERFIQPFREQFEN